MAFLSGPRISGAECVSAGKSGRDQMVIGGTTEVWFFGCRWCIFQKYENYVKLQKLFNFSEFLYSYHLVRNINFGNFTYFSYFCKISHLQPKNHTSVVPPVTISSRPDFPADTHSVPEILENSIQKKSI